MSEDKKEVVTVLPFSNQRNEVTKASEKVEMQRATAQVYGALQLAVSRPRDEEQAWERVEKMCTNLNFASQALYKKPVGGGFVEGVNVNATKDIARIWGNVEYGCIEHGSYDRESQVEAFSYDLEANVRNSARYTVRHERKANGKIEEVKDPAQIAIMVKARNSIEVRNCIQSAIPRWIFEEVEKLCKRTLHQAVGNVPEAWLACVKTYGELGVSESSLFRYVDKKPSERDKLNAAHIVDLRVLYRTIKEEGVETLDTAFPERDRKVNATKEGQADPKPVVTKLPIPKTGGSATAPTTNGTSTNTASTDTSKTSTQPSQQSTTASTQSTPDPKPLESARATVASGQSTETGILPTQSATAGATNSETVDVDSAALEDSF